MKLAVKFGGEISGVHFMGEIWGEFNLGVKFGGKIKGGTVIYIFFVGGGINF